MTAYMESGPPPDTVSRPQKSSTRTTTSVTDQSDTLRALVEKAAALIAAIGDQAARESAIDTAAFRAGYELGFNAGRDVGYGAAETDMVKEWAYLSAKVRGLASSPTHAELERRRWDGRREDFGKPRPGDHRGGPKPWNGVVQSGRGAA